MPKYYTEIEFLIKVQSKRKSHDQALRLCVKSLHCHYIHDNVVEKLSRRAEALDKRTEFTSSYMHNMVVNT